MQAWTGSSGGFITTLVNLPASAAGQTIRLNWQFGTDSEVNGSGWFVDTVSIIDGSYTCCTGSADMTVTQTASPNPAIAGQNLTYTLAITNIGSAVAPGVTVADILPAGVTFVSASPGATNLGGTVVAAPGTSSFNRRWFQPPNHRPILHRRNHHEHCDRDDHRYGFQPGQQLIQPRHQCGCASGHHRGTVEPHRSGGWHGRFQCVRHGHARAS